MRESAVMETKLVCVQRLLEYGQLKTEGNLEDQWGDQSLDGSIEFRDVRLRYAEEEEPVLKRINVSIRSGEKVY